MWYRSKSSKKKLRSFFPFPLLLCLAALFSLPFLFGLALSLALSFSPTLLWIMITQLLHIEQQQKVISGSVYLGQK